MRNSIIALGVTAIVAAAPGTLVAQDLDAICGSVENAEVGDWAEYQIESPQGSGTMRFAMLPEGASDAPGQWFEMSMNVNAQAVILQVLVDEWPFGPDDIDAIVIKPGAQPAMQVPDAAMTQMRSQVNVPMKDMKESCLKSELVGSESVAVAAGTFDAHHMKPSPVDGIDPGDVWVSSAVPFGIIKAVNPEGSMELLGTGGGATSTITETPQAMPMMPGMGGP